MNKNLKTALIIGGIVLVLLVIMSAFGGRYWGWSGGCWGFPGLWIPGGSSGFGWFMPLIWVLFWGLIIWAVVALVRGLSLPARTEPEVDSASEVLKRLYARGEISREEYLEKKRKIE